MTSVLSSKAKWGGGQSYSSQADRTFSQLDDMEDLRPLGHGTRVGRGSRTASMVGDEGPSMSNGLAVPSSRIGVKTDVVVETSERLTYNDRLY